MDPGAWIFGFVWLVWAVLPGSDVASDVGAYGAGLLGLLLIASFSAWCFVGLVRVAVRPLEQRVERIEARQIEIAAEVGIDPPVNPPAPPPTTRGFLHFWRQ